MEFNADQMVAVYIKMRDEKDRLTREFEERTAALKQ